MIHEKKGDDLKKLVNDRHPKTLYTPLHFAAEAGRMNIIKLLIESGASPTSRTKNDLSALQLAIKKRKDDETFLCDLTKISIKNGFDVNRKMGRMENENPFIFPLFYAISKGMKKWRDCLIKAGANLKIEDPEPTIKDKKKGKKAPLIPSSEQENVIEWPFKPKKSDYGSVESFALSHSSNSSGSSSDSDADDSDSSDSSNTSNEDDEIEAFANCLLLAAAYGGDKEMLNKAIEELKQDVNMKNESGEIDVLSIAMIGGNVEMVKYLIGEKGFKLKDVGDRSPLHIAVQQYSADLIAYLLQNGANPNVRSDYDGNPLLMDLCKAQSSYDFEKKETIPEKPEKYRERLACIKPFLENGADPNLTKTKDTSTFSKNKGETAIFNAIRSGNTEIVKLLLSKGADINHKSDAGRNVFWEISSDSVANMTPDLMQILIDAGFDLNEPIKDRKPKTLIAEFLTGYGHDPRNSLPFFLSSYHFIRMGFGRNDF